MKKKSFEIDILAIASLIWNDKKSLCAYALVSAAVGLVVAFSIPKEYTAKVLLAPETSSRMTSNISSLASMVGLNLGDKMSGDAIYPEIYPELITSMDFLTQLFPMQVATKDGKVKTTYYDYIATKQKIAWWLYPIAWVKNLMPRTQETVADSVAASFPRQFIELTLHEYEVAMVMSSCIKCNIDKKTSVISITTTAQDPLVAATLADSVKNKLQTFITRYRTNKARNDLAYMQKLFEEAKAQYAKARQNYGAYSDANQELILASYRTKQEDLENEMQLQYNIYTQVMQQLQMAKAKVQEKTPAFTVVQSAVIPIRKSNTPRAYIFLTFLIMGVGLRIVVLGIKNKQILLKEG